MRTCVFKLSPSISHHIFSSMSPSSGIGLALCERLLREDSQLKLCLACRNMQRAETARSTLLTSHPNAHVDLLHLDVGSVQSVLHAAQEVKAR